MTPSPDRLDETDRRILSELSQDARLSVRAIAERVHVSRTAAHSRLNRLIDAGVITGFGAQIDRAALGLGVSALVVVRIGEVPWEQMAKALAALPFVEKIQAVSGDIDIVLTVSAPDHDTLAQAVLRNIHDMPGVVSSRTHVILEEIDANTPARSLDVWR